MKIESFGSASMADLLAHRVWGAKIRFAPRESNDLQAGRQFWHPHTRLFGWDAGTWDPFTTIQADAVCGQRMRASEARDIQDFPGNPVRPGLRTLRDLTG